MGNKNRSDSQTSRAGGGLLSLSLWHLGATLVAVLATLAAASYLLSDPVADAYSSARDGVIETLGLGVVPIALWLAALVWTLVARRSWVRRVNLWLGSVALVALSLGIMAFFQPGQGALAGFTLDGEVSLGGDVGKAIIGPVTWLGVLRLVGIGIAGLAVTAPPLAVDLAARLGQLAVYVYVLLVLMARAIARTFRFAQSKRSLGRGTPAGDTIAEPSMPPEVLSPYTRVRAVPEVVLEARADEPAGDAGASPLEASISTVPSVPGALMAESAELRSDDGQRDVPAQDIGDETADAAAEPQSEDATKRTHPPTAGKFNRFWTSNASEREGEPDSPNSPNSPNIGGGPPGESDSDAEEGEEEHVRAEEPASSRWRLPSTELLEVAPEGGITEEQMLSTAGTIRQTLAEYGVEVEIGQVRPGPTVTMYGLTPGWVRRRKQVKEQDEAGRPKLDESGKPLVTQVESKTRVKVDNILSREKDLALALKTPSIRIETPVMGESLVGIEVPNPNPSLVTLRSVMESEEFTRLHAKAQLPIALGKGSGGETVVTDLAKMPHLLIAGATGSGKSACINAIISCLIMERTPAELRLLLIDPKRVELTPYNGIPHLLTPVVVETDEVVGLLKKMIREMLDRYRRMEEVGVRNIEAYNSRMADKMPSLIVAVDELADLMISASFDVEQSLCRLAQLGRATGIHLIVATQRPSVDVVTGLIKANFPSRISFGVTSQVDSRTILDTPGADKLLGRGDMLYLPLDASRPLRAQGVFISDSEIENLVNFWQTTPWAPVPEVLLRAAEDDQNEEMDPDSRDELLDKALDLAHSYSKLSTSLLQRRLRIGYPRAARLMDLLEDKGIVGPSDGSKSRDVIMNRT